MLRKVFTLTCAWQACRTWTAPVRCLVSIAWGGGRGVQPKSNEQQLSVDTPGGVSVQQLPCAGGAAPVSNPPFAACVAHTQAVTHTSHGLKLHRKLHVSLRPITASQQIRSVARSFPHGLGQCCCASHTRDGPETASCQWQSCAAAGLLPDLRSQQ